jgi:general secretion pathway protein H
MPAMLARAERGFTLLELLVVLAIIAALSAAFPLALSRFVPARRLDAAARVLVADIRSAQSLSLGQNKPVALEIEAHRYQVPRGESRELRSSTFLELRSADDLRRLATLRVFPDGSSSGGRFIFRDGAHTRVVVVSALTGRVRLERPR